MCTRDAVVAYTQMKHNLFPSHPHPPNPTPPPLCSQSHLQHSGTGHQETDTTDTRTCAHIKDIRACVHMTGPQQADCTHAPHAT